MPRAAGRGIEALTHNRREKIREHDCQANGISPENQRLRVVYGWKGCLTLLARSCLTLLAPKV